MEIIAIEKQREGDKDLQGTGTMPVPLKSVFDFTVRSFAKNSEVHCNARENLQ